MSVNISERLKEVRKSLKMNQREFSERISTAQNTYSKWENGVNDPNDASIALICREYNVDEHWLRTGEGEMFRQPSVKEAIYEFFIKVSNGELEKEAEWLAEFLATSTPEARRMVIAEIRRLSEIVDKNPGE